KLNHVLIDSHLSLFFSSLLVLLLVDFVVILSQLFSGRFNIKRFLTPENYLGIRNDRLFIFRKYNNNSQILTSF
ncbi:MAG: hypothetical protein PF445_07965, partial [Melioribacteraceae bacterium]|nr:hypothetical protein [Melioribacteraceae bacterium]